MYWQVVNAHGRMYLVEGETAEEAIDNARPLFASNHIRRPWGMEPNPDFAQVGMTAMALMVGDAT